MADRGRRAAARMKLWRSAELARSGIGCCAVMEITSAAEDATAPAGAERRVAENVAVRRFMGHNFNGPTGFQKIHLSPRCNAALWRLLSGMPGSRDTVGMFE